MQKQENHWKNSEFVLDFIKSLSIFNLALIINYFAVRYATQNVGNPVPDLFHRVLPYVDTTNMDQFGAYILYISSFVFFVIYQKKTSYAIKSLALLIFVRCIFVNLTYLGIPEGVIQARTFYTQGGDLFFSGHVALPFMIALIYWQEKWIRYVYLTVTFVLGAEVLFGRFHYSIDVFAALFITHSIFVFCENYLKKTCYN